MFRAGDRSDAVYRVTSGEAREAGNVVGVGGFVGEIGVLLGSSRSATVTVSAGTTLQRLTRKEFLRLIFTDELMAEQLIRSLSLRSWAMMERLCATDEPSSTALAVRSSSVLSLAGLRRQVVALFALTTAQLAELLRHRIKFIPEDLARRSRKARLATIATFSEVLVPKGGLVFEEGTPSENVYWIRKGTVHVTKRTAVGERTVGLPRPNEIIGEIGVMQALPRAASARAITDVVVQVLPSETFHALLRSSPAVYLHAIDALCERARYLMRELQRMPARELVSTGQDAALYQAICSMESVARLAEQRFANELVKIRRLFLTQVVHGKEIVHIYRKHSRGEALPEELERANAHFVDYLKLAGLGALLVLPGAPLSIPLASKMGKALGIDIFPASDDDD